MVMVNEKGVESMLEKEKVGFIKIEGKVSSEARKILVDRFQHNSTLKCLSYSWFPCTIQQARDNLALESAARLYKSAAPGPVCEVCQHFNCEL